MTASGPPIRADHVSKRFAKVVALDDVTLQMGRGEICRASTLMYGKRPTLPELMHWLRVA